MKIKRVTRQKISIPIEKAATKETIKSQGPNLLKNKEKTMRKILLKLRKTLKRNTKNYCCGEKDEIIAIKKGGWEEEDRGGTGATEG